MFFLEFTPFLLSFLSPPHSPTHTHRFLLRLLNLVGYLTLSVSVHWHHCFFSFLLHLPCFSDQWLRSTKSSRSLATSVSTILFTGRCGRGGGGGGAQGIRRLSFFSVFCTYSSGIYVCMYVFLPTTVAFRLLMQPTQCSPSGPWLW